MTTLTILRGDGEATVAARAAERATIAIADVAAATGWELRPEGLCRGAVCVPLRDRDALVVDDRVDLARLGEALHLPVVIDTEAGVAALGDDPVQIAASLRDRRAADFTLPTLAGTPFTFSSLGRKKKLLVAWASW